MVNEIVVEKLVLEWDPSAVRVFVNFMMFLERGLGGLCDGIVQSWWERGIVE